jgi:hypothetical protein
MFECISCPILLEHLLLMLVMPCPAGAQYQYYGSYILHIHSSIYSVSNTKACMYVVIL